MLLWSEGSYFWNILLLKKVTTKTLTLTIQQSDEDLLKTLVTKKMYSSS